MKSIPSLVVVLAVAAFAATAARAQSVTINERVPTMAYVEQSDIAPAEIPMRDFIAALDDNKDGAVDADVWAAIQAKVQTEIDGTLGQRYDTPFAAPLPALVKLAAVRFAIEAVYGHRNLNAEKSPWVINAAAMRKTLAAIAAGTAQLAPEKKPVNPSGSVIAEPSRTYSDRPAI